MITVLFASAPLLNQDSAAAPRERAQLRCYFRSSASKKSQTETGSREFKELDEEGGDSFTSFYGKRGWEKRKWGRSHDPVPVFQAFQLPSTFQFVTTASNSKWFLDSGQGISGKKQGDLRSIRNSIGISFRLNGQSLSTA